MRLQYPELTDNYELRVVRLENEVVEQLVNGFIAGLLVFGPAVLYAALIL